MTNKEAITWLNNLITSIGEPQHSELWHYEQALSEIKDMLKALPSAEPERKRGMWLQEGMWSEGYGMGETYGYYWRCSSCDEIVQGGYSQCGDNFCSNCGADMRGKEYV